MLAHTCARYTSTPSPTRTSIKARVIIQIHVTLDMQAAPAHTLTLTSQLCQRTRTDARIAACAPPPSTRVHWDQRAMCPFHTHTHTHTHTLDADAAPSEGAEGGAAAAGAQDENYILCHAQLVWLCPTLRYAREPLSALPRCSTTKPQPLAHQGPCFTAQPLLSDPPLSAALDPD